MGLLSPPGQQDQQQPPQLQPQVQQQPQQLVQVQQPPRRPSDDDIVFIASTGPTSVQSATSMSRPPPSQSRSSMQPQTSSRTPM